MDTIFTWAIYCILYPVQYINKPFLHQYKLKADHILYMPIFYTDKRITFKTTREIFREKSENLVS